MTDSGESVFKVYFLGGQSNMEGYGASIDLPRELASFGRGVAIFHGNPAPDGSDIGGRGVWAPLRPGHGEGFASDGKSNSYSDRFGPELSFAARLRELDPDAKVAIIKYARGGTSLHHQAAGTAGSWDPDYSEGNGINQYDHFLATVRNAMADSDIDGDGMADILLPAGIIWMQGESDAAYTHEIALNYEAGLRRMIALFRAVLRRDDLPTVIGRISDSGLASDGKVWAHGSIVRRAQESVSEQDALMTLVSTDQYGYSDRYHYDSSGYVRLGTDFAEAVVRLYGIPSPNRSGH